MSINNFFFWCPLTLANTVSRGSKTTTWATNLIHVIGHYGNMNQIFLKDGLGKTFAYMFLTKNPKLQLIALWPDSTLLPE